MGSSWSTTSCPRVIEPACASLLDIVDAWEPSEQRSVFTTNEQARGLRRRVPRQRLDRGPALRRERSADYLTQPKELSINKIGHAQHDLDDEFERFDDLRLAEIAGDIGMVDARALQSMYIFKQPHIGGEVGCHQDATFLYTDPISVTGFWFAIEDATLENGCLWAAPGGHRGLLRQLFKRNDTGEGTVMEQSHDTPLPGPPPAGDGLVPLEVPAGTLVVLNGKLPHWSDVNRSGVSRHAYTLHCVSAAADYPDWNWLQRPTDMPLRPLGLTADDW